MLPATLSNCSSPRDAGSSHALKAVADGGGPPGLRLAPAASTQDRRRGSFEIAPDDVQELLGRLGVQGVRMPFGRRPVPLPMHMEVPGSCFADCRDASGARRPARVRVVFVPTINTALSPIGPS
jgi:hypothetical protein